MIRALYNKDREYDEMLDWTLDNIDNSLHKKDDDFLLMCVGSTGTGKSMLMLHAMDKFLKDGADVKYMGLHQGDFANALKASADKELPRMCCNDEANISKRDSLTKYNKKLIDLYMSIRGKQIFHWWNNPSLDMIDKHFIEERIKGVIYIFTKDINRPRLYYFFLKRDLLKILEKYGNLKLETIKKVAKKYAYYRGWFKDYNGVLKQPYINKKEDRMDEKINDFYEKFGKKEYEDNMVRQNVVMKNLGVKAEETIKGWVDKLTAKGLVTEKDYIKKLNGHVFYSLDLIERIKNKEWK